MNFLPPLLLLTILSSPIAAQTYGGGFIKTRTHDAVGSGDLMGSDVTGLGDINGDGIGDYAACAVSFSTPSITRAGRVQAFSGADGSVIHKFLGPTANAQYGKCVRSVGDVDGDLVPDIAFGSAEGQGHLYVASGATGAIIHDLTGPATSQRFGETVVALGDVNADGVPDFAIGDSRFDAMVGSIFSVDAGGVWITSGADGTTIATFTGWNAYDYCGEPMEALGDVDGDGVTDFIVGSSGVDSALYTNGGMTTVHSGANGMPLIHVSGTDTYQFSPSSLAGLGDVNGDGFHDFVIGNVLDEPVGGLQQGSVAVHSGNPSEWGLQLLKRYADQDVEQLGTSLANAGDVDADGVDDILAGAAGTTYGGRAYVFSPLNGDMLWTSESEGWNHNYGESVAGLGDIDGDGNLEIMVGATSAWNMGPTPGAAYLLSFDDFATASTSTLSNASGGTVTWDLRFPDDYNHEPYRLFYRTLLSFNPGVSLAYDWLVPLGADPYLAMTASGTYPGGFVNPEGALTETGSGDATASVDFTVGPYTLPGSAIGRTAYLCFAAYELTSWGSLHVHGFSRAVPLTFTL